MERLSWRKTIGRGGAGIVLPLVVLLAWGCNSDIEEFRFRGTAVDGFTCGSTDVSYVIALSEPDSVGDTVTIGGKVYENAVRAYNSPRQLHRGQEVSGVAYRKEGYAQYHCNILLLYDHLPEMVVLSIEKSPKEGQQQTEQ